MLFSTALISPAPKPVTVLLCLGRVKFAGPTGPFRSARGALVEGRRSRGEGAEVAILRMSIAEKGELLSEWRCRTGEGGVEDELWRRGEKRVKLMTSTIKRSRRGAQRKEGWLTAYQEQRISRTQCIRCAQTRSRRKSLRHKQTLKEGHVESERHS